ncbi:MAG: hypothetical protein JW788_01520, partial [Candidatus Omnitrophica bacterium]|nr:hypothetical protein [Candidatus Omnitrophota bacterium]
RTVDLIKQKCSSAVIALGSNNKGKALLVLGLTDDLCSRGLDASKIVIETAGSISGSGGGRKDFAQAGGSDPKGFPQVFKKIESVIAGSI